MPRPKVSFLPYFAGSVSTHPLEWLDSLALSAREIDALLAESEPVRRRVLFERALAASRGRLRALLAEPLMREALFLSKPWLHSRLEASAAAPAPPPDEVTPLERQLARHLAGACSGASSSQLQGAGLLARVDSRQAARLRARRPLRGDIVRRRRTGPAPALLRRLAAGLSSGEARWHVKPRANPTWHEDPEDSSKLLFRRVDAEGRGALCRVPRHGLVAAFLEEAAPRSRTARALVSRVRQRFPELARSDAEAFYDRLCEQGLLIGRVEPPFDEPDGLGYLLRWLSRLPAAARRPGALGDLRRARSELARLDRAPAEPWERRRARYERALARLEAHSAPCPDAWRGASPWVVDAAADWELTLGAPALAPMREAVEALLGIFDSARDRRFMLRPFYEALRAAFPGRASAPLTELYRVERDASSKERLLLDSPEHAGPLERLRALYSRANGAQVLELSPERLRELALGEEGRSPWGAGRLVLQLGEEPGSAELSLETVYASASKDLSSWRAPGAPAGRLAAATRGHYRWLRGKTGDRLAHAIYGVLDRNTHDSWFRLAHERVVELDGPPSAGARRLAARELELAFDDRCRSLALRERASGERLRPTYDGLTKPATELDPCAELLYALSVAETPCVSCSFALPLAVGAVRRLPALALGGTRLTPRGWLVPAEELVPRAEASACEELVRRERWRREKGLPRFALVYPRAGARRSGELVDFQSPYSCAHLRELASSFWPPGTELILEDASFEGRALRSRSGQRHAHELRAGFRWEHA